MSSKTKLLLISITLIAIIWMTSYLFKPYFMIQEGRNIDESVLINSQFSTSNNDKILLIKKDNKCNFIFSDEDGYKDKIYEFSLQEGVLKLEDDYKFQILASNKIYSINEHYFMFRRK